MVVIVQTLGPYRIKRTIAMGGMGEVFLAALERMGGFEKQVALKCVLPKFVQDPRFKELFEREARLAAVLNHRNIVQVFDFGYDQERAWLAMEYVDGVDVKGVIDTLAGPLPPGIAINIGVSVARALHYAHRAVDGRGRPLHIIHRDVSPQNILLSFEGDVKLADFGLAQAAARNPDDDGTLKGKFAYMSPEQVSGRALDGRSDQFSLGVVLYEAFSGQRAFFREGGVHNILGQVLTGKPITPLRDAVPDLDPGICAVIERAMQKERTDRYRDTGAMADALLKAAADARIPLGNPDLGTWLRKAYPHRIAIHRQSAESTVEATAVAIDPIAQIVSHAQANEDVLSSSMATENTASAETDVAVNVESTTHDFPIPQLQNVRSDASIVQQSSPVPDREVEEENTSPEPGFSARFSLILFLAFAIGVGWFVWSMGSHQTAQAPPDGVARLSETGTDVARADKKSQSPSDLPTSRHSDATIVSADGIDARAVDAQVVDAQVVDAQFDDAQVVDAQVVDARIVRSAHRNQAQKNRRRHRRRAPTTTRTRPSREDSTASLSRQKTRTQSKIRPPEVRVVKPVKQGSNRPIKVTKTAADTVATRIVTQKKPVAVKRKPSAKPSGLRFKATAPGSTLSVKAPHLTEGWRRLSAGGTMLKVTNSSGSIVRMRIRSRGGRFDATVHARPHGVVFVNGKRMGPTPAASIPLKEGRQVIRLEFESGAPIQTNLEVAQ